jgi:acetolactate synthase I/II/III large subunit
MLSLKKMSGAKLIYNKLIQNKVQDVFMYSGGAIMPLVDCFYQGPIKYYINSHEQNCGHAATGYAKSSNRTGVCIVTSGPGLTNLITPILDANNDSSPLVVFSGQVPLNAIGTNAFQEAPSVEITKPVTKWSYCVQDVSELPYVVDKAFWIANNKKPGAVHIDLPKCVLTSTLDNNYKEFKPPNEKKNNLINYKFNEICKLINNSKRPVLYVGKGALNASNELRNFAIKANIPVTTTMHAMGVFNENHELSLQMVGMHGNYAANHAIQNSDCIIAIGSRFDDRTTGNLKYYAPKAKEAYLDKRGGIIHCNIEESEIGKVIDSNFNFCMESKEFLNNITSQIKFSERKKWLLEINNWKQKYPFTFTKTNKLKAQEVLQSLNNLTKFKENYIFTTGVGNHQMWSCQFISWTHPKSIISSGSLGVMGAGLPYSIGAQIANPDKNIILIDGDSSFNMTLTDLKTVKEHKLPIKIIIMNDGNQNMVRVWEQLFFNERITATKNVRNPSYKELAESFGIKSNRVESRNNLNNSLLEMLNYKGSFLLEVKVESDKCFPLNPPGTALDNLILSEEESSLGDEIPS